MPHCVVVFNMQALITREKRVTKTSDGRKNLACAEIGMLMTVGPVCPRAPLPAIDARYAATACASYTHGQADGERDERDVERTTQARPRSLRKRSTELSHAMKKLTTNWKCKMPKNKLHYYVRASKNSSVR